MTQELSTELIRAALLQFAEEELDWGSYGSYINYYDAKNRVWDVPGLGPVTVVDFNGTDSEKNYDGWSEQLWVVFKIGLGLYKATGTYTSYIGEEWEDELKLVKPTIKQVIVYEED
jgi:hypothetical protein